MIPYSQFCHVAKAAEVFGDRWTPIIMRELCFGTRAFGELLDAAPLISRTILAQRLKQLQASGVVHIEAKPLGKGHLYRLTPAGEDFRPIIGPAVSGDIALCMGHAPDNAPNSCSRNQSNCRIWVDWSP